jgi:hypothetical protein
MAMPQCAVVRVNPPGFEHAGIFTEITETIHHGLTELGCDSVLVDNTVFAERINIIFAGHMLHYFGDIALPPRAVLFNLEQIRPEIMQLVPHYAALLRRADVGAVWEYNRHNLPALAALGVARSAVIEIGYAAPMTRISPAAAQDIDVLFYGVPSERRLAMQARLREAGLNAQFVFGVYGAERDALIARAKVVLNLSQFDAGGMFDTVRLSYLLSNRKCVLAESGIDAEREREFGTAVAFVACDDIVAECLYLCSLPAERERQAGAGFAFFSARRQSELLRAPVAALVRHFGPD